MAEVPNLYGHGNDFVHVDAMGEFSLNRHPFVSRCQWADCLDDLVVSTQSEYSQQEQMGVVALPTLLAGVCDETTGGVVSLIDTRSRQPNNFPAPRLLEFHLLNLHVA